MTIFLDAALYLREQIVPKEKKLTVTERGAFFTLLFRQGSNSHAWVSQETLATELDISISNVRRLMKNIEKKGWISIQKNKKDKRKLDYRGAQFLVNYHQLPREQTKKYRSKSGGNSTKKYRSKLSGISKNTAQNQAVSKNQKTATSHVSSRLQEIVNVPKEQEKIINNKRESDSLKEYLENEEAQNLCREKNLNIETEFNKFKNHFGEKKITTGKFLNWIIRARTDKPKNKPIINTVQRNSANTTYAALKDYTQERLERESKMTNQLRN